mgnify:CR=1 FL=1
MKKIIVFLFLFVIITPCLMAKEKIAVLTFKAIKTDKDTAEIVTETITTSIIDFGKY